MRYFSEIIRNPTLSKGPGWWTIFKEQTESGVNPTKVVTVVAAFPCITGGNELDPTKYGGICPPVVVQMVTDIYPHTEGNRDEMDFAQIIPIDARLTQELYPLRTWYNEGDWFKIHQMGVSTGCIGPYAEYWDYAKEYLNIAAENALLNEYIFEISIKDIAGKSCLGEGTSIITL